MALGCNFFDTAWAYGDGKSEGLLGELIRRIPSGGSIRPPRSRPKIASGPAAAEFTLDDCYPPDYIRQYVESSLQNSGLAAFDLMQLHTWEDGWLADDRWFRAWTT